MLVLGLDIPLWVALVSLTAILLYWHGTSTYDAFKKMGVPYIPVYIPYLGNMPQLVTTPLDQYEHKWMKKFPGKIHGVFQGRQPVLQVSDAEFVKEVTIKEFTSFTNRRVLVNEDSIASNHIATTRDDHWKHVRTLISPTFTSGKLKQMYPVINECAKKFVKHLESKCSVPIAIKDYTSGYTMSVIASTAFGLDIDAQSTTDHPFIYHAKPFFGNPKDERAITKFKSFLTVMGVFFLPHWLIKYMGVFIDTSFLGTETMDYFNGLFNRVLDDTKEQVEGGNNFITMCSDKMVDLDTACPETVKVTDGRKWSTEGLTRKDILANAAIFLSAGYETTATTLQFFFYLMSLNPEIQEKLYTAITEVVDERGDCCYEDLKKLEYLDWCVSESLRMFPPATRLERQANADVTVEGINIPKEMIVEVKVYAMHYDPDYWVDPETFNPDRFAPENKTDIQQYAYAPFGAGNRKCIAMRLALLETKVAIAKALMAFRFEKCAETPELKDLMYKPVLGTLQVEKPLMVSAVPR